jgi:hypothetical protein
VHAVFEHHKLRSVTTANPNKRLRDEQQVTTLNLDGGSQPQPCFNFQKGKCNRGSQCQYSHTTESHVKKVQFAIPNGKGNLKGRFKGKGKPVLAVNIPFKGSKGSKGSKGKGKGKGNHKGDGKGKGSRDSQPVHCNRCESSHHGATGKLCVMPPCRYCLSIKARYTNHHLKDCKQRPAEYEFVPNTRPPGKRPFPLANDNPSPAKVAKVSADAWLQTATVKDFDTMRQRTYMIGTEYDLSKGIGVPSEPAEQVTAVVKYAAPPKPTATAKAAETLFAAAAAASMQGRWRNWVAEDYVHAAEAGWPCADCARVAEAARALEACACAQRA